MKYTLGVDVGATKILIALFDKESNILYSKKYKTYKDTQEASVNSVTSSIDDFMNELKTQSLPSPEFIGIGLVGHIDPVNGVWLQSYNIPISTPVPLAQMIAEKYNVKVALDNDVHCAALGENYCGFGKDYSCLLYINVGTGLSAGIVQNGILLRGADNYAGEIGYMMQNCETDMQKLEPIASGGGLIDLAVKNLKNYPDTSLAKLYEEGNLHSASIFACAKEGDELSTILTDRALLWLSVAVCNLMAVVNPDCIVFGGGVVKDSWFFDRLCQKIKDTCVPETLKSLKFMGTSALDPEKIGVIGASLLYR